MRLDLPKDNYKIYQPQMKVNIYSYGRSTVEVSTKEKEAHRCTSQLAEVGYISSLRPCNLLSICLNSSVWISSR